MGSEDAGSKSSRCLVKDLDEILASALENGATAVHLFEGEAPAMRGNGRRLNPLPFPPVSREQMTLWLRSLAARDGWCEAERAGSGPTLVYSSPTGGSFRGRFLGGGPATGMVLFPLLSPPPLDPRDFPPPLRHLADLRGLVLVAGGIAAGKTTLLASLVAWLSGVQCWRILALAEEPAHFLASPGRSWISRWEIPQDCPGMVTALASTLARDAELVAIDPLRDAAAIEAALDLAESGKLVLATREAEGAAAAVASLVRTLGQNEKHAGCERLAATLRLVVWQTRLRLLDGQSAVAVHEILPGHPAVAAAIRCGALAALGEFVQVAPKGGKRVDDALWDLCQSGVVGAEEAFWHARDKARFLSRLEAAMPRSSVPAD